MKWMIVYFTVCSFLFATDLKIKETDTQDIVMELVLSNYDLTIVKNNELTFQKIILDSQSSTTMTIGQPELPLVIKTLTIPKGASVSVELISTEYQEIKITHKIWPHQELEIDGIPEKQEFIIDERFYQQNSFLPKKIVDVSQVMTWRDLEIVHLKLAPVLYNPVRNLLRIYKKITFKVVFSHQFSVVKISSKWLPLYKDLVANFFQVQYYLDNQNETYLVIVYQEFAQVIQPLVDWYSQQGLQVFTLAVDSNVTSEWIKEKVFKYYNHYGLDWVLLVGDAEFIKPYFYEGYCDSFPSDAYYSFLVGDDFYADIGIGRLSGKTSQEISNQVKKIVNYQQLAQGWWLNKTILIAHKQFYPEKYSACKREIFNADYHFFAPEMDTLFGACGATNADVIEVINEGVGLVNYRGHGSTIAWTGWGVGVDFSAKYIDNLDNQDKTPIVLNICCLNHKFHWTEGDCLGETWLKKYPGGAVASLSASDPSYTTPNHLYDKSLYRAFYDLEIREIGLASNYAAAKIIEQFATYGEQNVKMYLWFGDPAMSLKVDKEAPKPAYPSNIILRAYPNPSSSKLVIRYFLPTSSQISLKIYDIAGRLILTLKENGLSSKGYHQFFWFGQDAQGRLVSTGVYFVHLSIIGDDETKVLRRKIVWIK